MKDLVFSVERYKDEIEEAKQRNLTKKRLFVLLLGPSAVGKSTVIQELSSQSDPSEFEYVKPLITRPNRPGEVDKVSISEKDFELIDEAGEFVVVNRLYGVRYGTPLAGILDPLSRGTIPVLDYPLANVAALKRSEYDLLNFYIYPPSVAEWQKRMELSGRNLDGRFEDGIKELGALAAQSYLHQDVDISLINNECATDEVAKKIRESIELITTH